jgi:hypothetical protein
MARPPQHENGAYGVPGVTREGDESAGPPNVYHPWAEPMPLYEEYADPAAAHGWQNTYDQTRELPAVPADVQAVVRGAGPGRRGTRRKPPARRSRRALVAVGAVGVSAAALIAGFSFSGSSPDGARDLKGGGARSVPDEPNGSTGAASSADPALPSDAPPATPTAGTAPVGADASRGSTAGATQAAAPSPTPSTGLPSTPSTSAPVSTAPAVTVSGPGNSDSKGRGHGSTKGPK